MVTIDYIQNIQIKNHSCPHKEQIYLDVFQQVLHVGVSIH